MVLGINKGIATRHALKINDVIDDILTMKIEPNECV
jgi:hypothetical protein